MAGIGGVVTHTSYRHKGLASKLLLESVQFLRSNHLASFCILCTDMERLGKLYSKVGFLPLEKPYYFINKNGTEKEETGGMVCQIDSGFSLDTILNKNIRLNIGLSNI